MSLTALITGGTSGIGRAVANKLAQLGIHVVVVGRNRERSEKTVAEIRAAGGQPDFISSDLGDASVAKRAVELGGGHVDILINNVGIFPFGPTHEMTEETFDSVYAPNVKAPDFLVAELAPLMAKRGKGAIVNVSTMVADYGAPGMSLYGSSKAAINLLTKAWAAEYGPKGVRVNAVSPGPTRSEATEAMGEGVEQLAAQAPAGRPAKRTKLPRPLSSWQRIVLASFTARSSPSMEGALLSDGATRASIASVTLTRCRLPRGARTVVTATRHVASMSAFATPRSHG
jgi:NAD(P)-dependent dehydrogenase (short-subunit alcohol dehydrogenase family)